MTARNILLETLISQEGQKGEKHTQAEFIFLSSMHGQSFDGDKNKFTMLSSGLCQNRTRFWCLGSRRTGTGAEFLVTGWAVWACLLWQSSLLFMWTRSRCSPRGAIPWRVSFRGNLSKLWWKLSCCLPLLICLGYMGQKKNAATHQNGEKKFTRLKNETIQQFLFSHSTSLWVAPRARQQ